MRTFVDDDDEARVTRIMGSCTPYLTTGTPRSDRVFKSCYRAGRRFVNKKSMPVGRSNE